MNKKRYSLYSKWVRDELHFCDGDVFTVEISADDTILLEKRNTAEESE